MCAGVGICTGKDLSVWLIKTPILKTVSCVSAAALYDLQKENIFMAIHPSNIIIENETQQPG
jgi:hypothetical protein